ncbi:MAG: dihydroorotate dehydrogenase electron transfer subunit [Bacteroidetes bacterium]|nr:MAG: dihydroorotate dehydrogenase electron transfer subunit [Bacteroidota bacterium]
MHTKKQLLNLRVVDRVELNHQHVVLTCTSDEVLPPVLPGQFAEISAGDTGRTYLRRPFSVHDYHKEANTLSFLIRIIGNGTALIASTRPGDSLSVIMPLGNSFSMPRKGERVLLTGGGSGVAPLLLLAKAIEEQGGIPDILVGARDRENLIGDAVFAHIGNLYTTTEDGSVGTKGLVIDHPIMQQLENRYSRIYTCGPDPMMKAVAALAEAHHTPCEVSLENTMACGIGACLCCVTETLEGNQCVCTEGPIFNSKRLKWQH